MPTCSASRPSRRPRPRWATCLAGENVRPPSVLWATVKSWTRLGSAIFVMDLLRPASREDARKLVDEHARGEPDVLRTDFYNSLLAAYRPDEVRSQLADASLTHFAIEVISDRHWIAWGRVSAAEEKAKSKL